jgi:hypothetical protein
MKADEGKKTKESPIVGIRYMPYWIRLLLAE